MTDLLIYYSNKNNNRAMFWSLGCICSKIYCCTTWHYYQ